jgi:hypothetical protein
MQESTSFFVLLISHGYASPIDVVAGSKNRLYYLSFKYCLIVVNPEALPEKELKQNNELHPPVVGMRLPGAQEQVLLSVEPYTLNTNSSVGWELQSPQVAFSADFYDKTKAFVFPLLLISSGFGKNQRLVFGPYHSYQVDLTSRILTKGSFRRRLLRAFLVRETLSVPYSQTPLKFERFRRDVQNLSSSQKPLTFDWFRRFRHFKQQKDQSSYQLPLSFRGVSYDLGSAFQHCHFTAASPIGSNWVVQYERDSTNRFVPFFANTEYSKAPEQAKFEKLPQILKRSSYVNILLPVAQNLNNSVYVHPALSGIWTNCPESFVVEMDFFLKQCVDLFFSKNWLNKSEFETIKNFRNSFVEVLLPYNFFFLSVLGVLQKKHVDFFIKSVDYKLLFLKFEKRNAPSDIPFVVGVTTLLGEYVQTVLLNNLTVEQQASIGVCKDRTRVLDAISRQII